MRRNQTRFFLFAALAGLIAMAACSLNPQPIPPGDADGDAGHKFGTGSSDAGSNPVIADGGGTGTVGDTDADADAGDAATDEDAGDADADAGDI